MIKRAAGFHYLYFAFELENGVSQKRWENIIKEEEVLFIYHPGPSRSALRYQSHRLNGSGPMVNSYTVEDDQATFHIAILEFVKVSQMFATFLQENNHQELALHIYMLGASICSQRQGALQFGKHIWGIFVVI